MVKIPKRITPCPIVEAIVEIRFETSFPSDAIFGILYTKLSEKYKNYEKLPILQMPEFIRLQDPELKYQPYYKLLDDNFWVQIGSNVISISNVETYAGWDTFSQRVKEVIRYLSDSKIVTKITRFGIRYIDFFKLDIFEKINLKITLNENLFLAERISFQSSIIKDNSLINLQISNNVNVSMNGIDSMGSIIDIDTYVNDLGLNFLNQENDILEISHQKEKELFFEILDEKFLESLSPEY
jgi:uncharacterized protein (TIGR04255 family)